jgi:hypothetical protein
MSQSTLGSAIEIYQEEGFSELAKRAGKKFLISPVVDPVLNGRLVDDLSQKSLANEDLLRYAKEEGKIHNWNSDLTSIDVPPLLLNAIDCSQRKTCVLPHGTIIGNRGLALTEDNQPILQTIKHSDAYFITSVRTAPISIKMSLFVSNFEGGWNLNMRNKNSSKNAIDMVMHTGREHHYGHWLTEYLPELYHLHQYEVETDIEPDILVNNNPPKWMIDSIVELGYRKNRIVEFDYTERKIQNLLIPLSSLTGDEISEISFSPVEFRWLREQYRRKLVKTHSGPDRIYVSRQGLPRRMVANYTEVREFLADNGFRIIKPEKLKFTEQIKSFSNADIIMGGYGSGLHNMIYAEDAKVIEFFPPEYPNYLNHALASALGHEYKSLDGTEERPELIAENKGRKEKNHSYNISIKELKSVIE